MLLDQIKELLAMHGVDGSRYDRIDIALDALLKAEKAEHKAPAKTESPKQVKKEKAKKEEPEVTGFGI